MDDQAESSDKSESHSGSSGVADGIEKVANSKLTLLLLGPTAKLLGEYLKERTETYISRLRKEAQDKYLADHVSQVIEVVGGPLDVKPSQFVKVEHWLRIACDVPIEDAERSALIQATLADILCSDGTSEYQRVAEEISTDAARILLNAPPNERIAPKSSDQRSFESLNSLGLARRWSLLGGLTLIGAWCLGTGLGLALLYKILPRFFPKLIFVEFVTETLAISFFILALLVALTSANYRLTNFGQRMQRSARRFYHNQERVRGIGALTVTRKTPWLYGLFACLVACCVPPILDRFLPDVLSLTARPTITIVSAPQASSPQTSPLNPPESAFVSSNNALPISRDDADALIDFWDAIAAQMDALNSVCDRIQTLMADWPTEAEKNTKSLTDSLSSAASQSNQSRSSLLALMNSYRRYPNVEALYQDVSNGNPFNNLTTSLSSFSAEALAAINAKNAESRLKPYASGIKIASHEMIEWANTKQKIAVQQSRAFSQLRMK